MDVQKDSFLVHTGSGCLRVYEVQLEGKKRMSVEEFLRGYTVEKGTRLGLNRIV